MIFSGIVREHSAAFLLHLTHYHIVHHPLFSIHYKQYNMKKPFDLDYYLQHPDVPVVTREGLKVRILATNLHSDEPIVAAVQFYEDSDFEVARTYFSNGHAFFTGEANEDLFLEEP